MKKYIVNIIVFSHFFYCTATDQETFLQANESYTKKEFKQALYLYQRIDNKGAAVWFNMGNCWYHVDQYVDALLCWKRALNYGGSAWYNEVAVNCDAAYQKLAMQKDEPVWYEKVFLPIMSYSTLWWQLMFLACCYGLFMMFVFFSGNYLYCMGTFCGLLITISGICLGFKYTQCHSKKALVRNNAWLTAGTDERFSKICMLKMGQEVTVQEKKDEWYKVKDTACVGWILAENIEYINV